MKSTKTTLLFFLITIFVSCNKSSTDSDKADEIKSLSHHSPLDLGPPSQVYLNKSTTSIGVEGYRVRQLEGDIFVVLHLKNKDIVYLSLQITKNLNADGKTITAVQNADGKKVIAEISKKGYNGQNLTAVFKNSNEVKISGELIANDDENDKIDIIIFFNANQLSKGNSSFEIQGTTAKLNGTLGEETYNQVLELNKNNPEVHTLLLENVPGSINDDVNLETGRLIREAGYTTKVPSYGKIYSGGVDLFCSGKKRLVKSGGIIGVHSWCCGTKGEDAKDIPENDGQHDKQISYFKEMLGDPIGREFYFFTINSAGYKGIHNMTQEKIKKYGLIKE